MDMLATQRLDELAAPKRNNYFYGKLLDELHLKLEQQYVIGKRAQLNRLALGSGVLCGLTVSRDGDKHLRIAAGIAIDGFGREIVVPDSVRVDTARVAEDCCTTRPREPDERTLYLNLCYRECKSDYVPAIVTDCLPEDRCAPSTIVESYCVELSVDAPPPRRPHNEALCEALRKGQNPEQKRSLIDAVLAGSCGRVEGNGCVLLAIVHLNADGNITDTAFDAPQHIYSNAALFDMLLCLGAGGEGPPGLGLDPDLPKIVDVSWEHKKAYQLFAMSGGAPVPGSFLRPYLIDDQPATLEELTERIRKGDENAPLFTIYFNRPDLNGIDRETFLVTLRFEFAYRSTSSPGGVVRPGMYFDIPLAGEVRTVTAIDPAARTPRTNEAYQSAAIFFPRPEFLLPLMLITMLGLAASQGSDNNAVLRFSTFKVELKGDFVSVPAVNPRDDEHGILDAENIGGWVGSTHLRDQNFIKGSGNPSGNLAQGGAFESWFRIEYGGQIVDDSPVTGPQAAKLMRMVRLEPESLPLNFNIATRAQLETTGLNKGQVDRILLARRERWFTNESDLRDRARLQPRVLRDLAEKITLL